MVAIAQNHPFEEGNKRAAFIAATVFAEDNGHLFDSPDDESFAELLKAVIKHEADEGELEAAFAAHLHVMA